MNRSLKCLVTSFLLACVLWSGIGSVIATGASTTGTTGTQDDPGSDSADAGGTQIAGGANSSTSGTPQTQPQMQPQMQQQSSNAGSTGAPAPSDSIFGDIKEVGEKAMTLSTQTDLAK